MSKKYSSFKKQQLLTESWRRFLNEGESVHRWTPTAGDKEDAAVFKAIKDSKPRFGQALPTFASVIDKGLYIVYNAMKKSRAEPKFLHWLSSLGYCQDQMTKEGHAVKKAVQRLITSHPNFSGWGNTAGLEINLPQTAEEPDLTKCEV